MNGAKNSKALKWIVGIGAPLLAVSMAAVFGLTGKTPPCIFYQLTELYCPGCGTGRSLLALLRLDIYAAFRYQPLFFLTYPLMIAIRIRGEERLLEQELSGYREYKEKVKYRLIPFVW